MTEGLNRRRFLEVLAVGGLAKAAEVSRPVEALPEAVFLGIRKLESFGLKPEDYAIVIDADTQKLYLIRNEMVEKIYPVSTGKKGVGGAMDSGQTPLGAHRIKTKVGEGSRTGTVFKFSQPTLKISLSPQNKAYMTSRLLVLQGLEPGVNKGGNIDSEARNIYIHGTNFENRIGRPASGGCIRMKNDDIIELFNLVPEGTLLEISPPRAAKDKVLYAKSS